MTSAEDELLATLKRVRGERGRFVDEPVELIPKAWRSWVLDENRTGPADPPGARALVRRPRRVARGAAVSPRPEVVADDDALSRVAQVTHAHLNSLGRYDPNRQPPPSGQLRPLRQKNRDDRAVPTPPLGVSGDKH